MAIPISSFLFGANYPWSVHGTLSMYGRDFGEDQKGVHAGISTRRARIERDFAGMRDAGIYLLRWFLFCDGRAGVRFENGEPQIGKHLLDDMDVALACAERYNIKLIVVLLDYLWMSHGHVPTPARLSRGVIDELFVTLFRHCGNHANIFAWEVMNEPDWIVNELDVPEGEKRSAVSLDAFRLFVHDVSEAVHAWTSHAVTLGGGRVKYLHTWDDDFLGLDFLEVHPYNDFLGTPFDEPLYGVPCSDLHLQRPLLIGEFPADLRSHRPAKRERVRMIPVSEYLSFLRSGGYAGALYWSFNGVDEFGTLPAASITSLA